MELSLGVEDLFAAGLGLDLTGAYVLSRGLRSSLPDMATARTFAGMGAQATIKEIRDHVDARTGLIYLGLGFFLQAVGCVAEAAGVDEGRPSLSRAALFAAITVIVLLVAFVIHERTSGGRIRQLALEWSHYDGHGLRQNQPHGERLFGVGIELGAPAHKGETYGQYARRVWSVEDVTEAGDAPREGAQLSRQAGRE